MKHSATLTPDNDYEAWLQEFDLRELDAPDRRSMWSLKYCGRIESVLEILRRLSPGARSLEVGASQANTSLLAAEAGLTAVALDRDPRGLRYAWRKHTSGSFLTVCGDALQLPMPDGGFDVVLGLEILEHLPEPAVALREMKRVLAPGGLLVVTTPNAAYFSETLPSYTQRPSDLTALPEPDGSGHLFAFTLSELCSLMGEAGFETVLARYEGSVVMSDRLPLRRLLPVRWVHALSRLLTRLPGGQRLAYSCFVVGRARK